MANKVVIVGGGLAGSEAAWQLAKRGYRVELYEMRPGKSTPAHKTGLLAELVCSNSFRSLSVENAVGLLKAELAMLDSLIMEAAYSSQLPAGGALAVDREQFASFITDRLAQHPLINIYRQEITTIPDHRPLIIATGPLTSDALACKIVQITGQDQLYFYDAAAPIVDASTINEERVFRASRYGKGGGDYINCPLTEEEYTLFWQELLKAEQYPLHSFEEEVLFEGCMPVESLAKRGFDTLRFGPLKPVGLVDPYTGKQPFAVVQLRQDNKEGTLYNMVGFQTKLKWPEQKRVFRLIPGLENADFYRYGSLHRNTFVNAPLVLKPSLEFKNLEGVFLAGQITGVEGYVESTAMGLVAAFNVIQFMQKKQPLDWPPETAIGALLRYLQNADAENFQPMNINFGLFPQILRKLRKKERKRFISQRATKFLNAFKESNPNILA